MNIKQIGKIEQNVETEPVKEKNRSKSVAIGLIAVFAICFIVCGIGFVTNFMDEKKAVEEYAGVEDEFTEDDPQLSDEPDPGLQEDPQEEDLRNYTEDWLYAREKMGFCTNLPDISLSKLRSTNSDIWGWIYIPDTNVSMPLLQGVDNVYYLEHSYKGNDLVAGTIMLDCRNEKNLSDPYSVIWGHSMRNGTMFGKLHEYYGTTESAANYRYCYIIHRDGTVRVYEFLAFVSCHVDGVMIDFDSKESTWLSRIAAYVKENNKVDTEDDIDSNDKILSLACCLKPSKKNYRNYFVFKEVYNGSYIAEQ